MILFKLYRKIFEEDAICAETEELKATINNMINNPLCPTNNRR